MRLPSKMLPTTFDTYALNTTPSTIVLKSDHYQRATCFLTGTETAARVSPNSTALVLAEAIIPGKAFVLQPFVFDIFTVPPGQALHVGSTLDNGGLLSVAVSHDIPKTLIVPHKPRPSTFETFQLSATERIPIADDSPFPQRVVISVPSLTQVQISADSAPFARDAIVGFPIPFSSSYTFVKAPGQLFYLRLVSHSQFSTASVHIADIPIHEIRGTTGIPGPDSQE